MRTGSYTIAYPVYVVDTGTVWPAAALAAFDHVSDDSGSNQVSRSGPVSEPPAAICGAEAQPTSASCASS